VTNNARRSSPTQSVTSGDQWPERVQNVFIILCPVRNFWPAGHETLTCVPTLVTAELTTRSANGGHETAANTTRGTSTFLYPTAGWLGTGCQQNHQILKNFQRIALGFPLFWGLAYHLGSDQLQTLQFIDSLTSRHFATCFASDVKRWQTFEAEAQDNFPSPFDSLCSLYLIKFNPKIVKYYRERELE